MTTTIDGPAGALEAIWQPGEPSTRCALLCHPHPQYGGNMHDGVLGIAAEVLGQTSPPSAHLRFNFRGVGASAGSYDDGIGEQDDLIAAWDWLASQHDWSEQLLIGYSFGAATAWAARERCANLSRLVLIAPPTAAMPFSGSTGDLSSHVIVGTQDSYCNTDALPPGTTATLIDGGDHFFSGVSGQLAAAISDSVG